MISFVIAGVVCAFAGLCYAELASMLPVSGSAYTYSYTTVGEFGAWIMGALLLLEYGLAASVVAVGWTGYAVSLLHDAGINLPANFLSQASGKFVVEQVTNVSVVDPVVSLNGVVAKLADGSTVQFVSESTAHAAGTFTASPAKYDVLNAGKHGVEHSGYALTNALDMVVNSDSTAVLDSVNKVMDPATRHLRELAAGTSVTMPTGSVIHLPANTVVPLPESAVVKSLFNLPAVFITLAVTLLLVIGVSESATVNNIIVGIKVTVILRSSASAHSS